jgi:hypothetical protein
MIQPTQTPVYCANHPTVETSLRCNRCGKPICARCAIRTPTGYRCKECVRGQQKIFVTAVWVDYLFGGGAAAVLGLIASLLVTLIGGIGLFGIIIVIIGAPTVGVIIAEAVRWVTRKHRSRPLFLTVAGAVILGALPVILWQLFSLSFFNLIYQALFLFIAVPVVYTRLSGIQLTR